MSAALFDYSYIPHSSDTTIVLLHGTGGDKNDWLFLDEVFEERYNLLSVSGNIIDSGKRRFFSRNEQGVFDIVTMREEMDKLVRFIAEWRIDRKFDCAKMIFLGYSNGAAMVLGLLFDYSNLVHDAVLLHPILPFTPHEDAQLRSKRIYMSMGLNDSIISPDESQRVIDVLRKHAAVLEVAEFSRGHEVHREEIEHLKTYMLEHYP